ncbi:MAG: hypothetical protein RLZZ196_161, partial [Bacteroidota bacterium]
RSKIFNEIEGIFYSHEFWDHNYGPIYFKKRSLTLGYDYFLFMSDDIMVSREWDTHLVNFLNMHDGIVSANYIADIKNKNAFDLEISQTPTNVFAKTSFIDNRFMFAKPEIFEKLDYPLTVKYYGENELLSINAYNAKIDVFAAPTVTYHDLNRRILENVYVPFSLEHGYGKAMKTVKESEWAKLFNIDVDKIVELPYIKDDPIYDMDQFEIEDQDVGGKRFAYGLKAIY